MADAVSERSPSIHDGGFQTPPPVCPRGLLAVCTPLARVASSMGPESFICCGETDAAPVPTDRLRFCVKATHDNQPTDIMVNFDDRDATDSVYVLMGGLVEMARQRAIREGIHG